MQPNVFADYAQAALDEHDRVARKHQLQSEARRAGASHRQRRLGSAAPRVWRYVLHPRLRLQRQNPIA